MANRLPESIIQYVIRTHESVILNDATREGNFINEPYIIQHHQTQSLLCLPLLNQDKLVGVLSRKIRWQLGHLHRSLTSSESTIDSGGDCHRKCQTLFKAPRQQVRSISRSGSGGNCSSGCDESPTSIRQFSWWKGLILPRNTGATLQRLINFIGIIPRRTALSGR